MQKDSNIKEKSIKDDVEPVNFCVFFLVIHHINYNKKISNSIDFWGRKFIKIDNLDEKSAEDSNDNGFI